MDYTDYNDNSLSQKLHCLCRNDFIPWFVLFWRSYPFVEIDRLFDDTFVGVLSKYYFIVQNCHAMHVIDKLNG